MAGYWQRSRSQELDANDDLIPGALAYFYEAATSTPMTVYSAAGLGEANEHPNPVEADADARWPQVFFDDATFSFYRVRVTDPDGALIYDDDSVPIIGQQAGEGEAEVPVNPDALATTGDVKFRLDTGSLSGWVRVNGRTIGSATSGATERANADTQPLFVHMWTKFSNTLCAVSGGRGVSAAADFAANKTLALLSARGRSLFGLDDMGNTAAGVIAGGTTLGASGGAATKTLVTGELPSHAHAAGSLAAAAGGAHGHSWQRSTADSGDTTVGGLAVLNDGAIASVAANLGASSTAAGDQIGGAAAHTHTVSGSTAAAGSGTAFNTISPYVLVTIYVKL